MGLSKRSFSLATANSVIHTGPVGLYAVTVAETAAVAAAATVTIFDNTAASGDVLATIRLAADGHFVHNWADGVGADVGITIDVVGEVNGSILIGTGGTLSAVSFTATGTLFTGAVDVVQAIAAETAGAAAEFRLYDDVVVAGTPFMTGPLAANRTEVYTWARGARFSTGVQAEEVAGAVAGTVYIR